MPSLSSLRAFKYALLALLLAGPHGLFSKPLVLPQHTAAHFCQLMVADGSKISPMYHYASQVIQPEDSLSVEQIFAGYVLLADGWQSLRVFPHKEGKEIKWFSAVDELPASIDAEHQRYISEVFPRMIAEAQAGRWQSVDAYIDKMIQYQCRFGGSVGVVPVSSAFLSWLAVVFMVLFLVSRFIYLSLHPKRSKV